MVALLAGTQVTTDNGLMTQYGIILPPGSQVAAYVRSIGVQPQDAAFIATNLVPTLAQGLARVRPNLGDFVVVLPGHVENVTDGTTFSGALIAGTKIIGVGRGGNTPTFNFINVGSTSSWVIGVNDVMIAGLRLLLCGPNASGANTALGISITGNDCGIYGNEIETGTSTNNCGTGIGISGAASRYDVSGNIIRSQIGATTTTSILVSSTGSDGRICDNEIIAGATVATGNISVTGAATRLKILRNYIENITAASVAAMNFANVAIDGLVSDNKCYVKNTGGMVSGTNVIVLGAGVLAGFSQNFCSNDVLKSGIILPTADT